MDLIERQVAIDALGDEPEVWTGKDEYAQGLNNQWHYDRNAIKALPSAQPEQRWIPMTERLPEEGIDVLCCFYNGQNSKIIVSRRTDYNYWNGVGRTGDMVAWMLLPEPYKGE